MSKNIDQKGRTIYVVAAAAILMVALPVLAHCGKCAADGRALAAALKSGKVNLASASTLAETTTKGVAVRAMVHKHEDGCFVEVHCMVEDKIMAVQVDCTTGKAGEPAEVKDLESHAPTAEGAKDEAAGESQEASSEADVQSKLDEVAQATKDGKLASAEESLRQLEELKNLSESMKSKVDSARQALDAAKAASDAKKSLPGLP